MSSDSFGSESEPEPEDTFLANLPQEMELVTQNDPELVNDTTTPLQT